MDEKMPRWLKYSLIALGSLCALSMGGVAGSYGGIPHDYDRFGVVGVPGQQMLQLPAGRVMIDRADDVYGCWDNTGHVKNATLIMAPKGMRLSVSAVQGDATPLKITPVSSSYYESQMKCRGHRPYGRIEVPAAGRYVVTTAADERDRPGTSVSGPGFAFGPAPWAPFGSPVLAGLLVALVLEVCLLLIPYWIFWKLQLRPRRS